MREKVDRTYYDQNGMEIGEGDLLQIFHFIHYLRRKKCYMYHVAVIQQTPDGPYWAGKDYNVDGNKGHYWFKAIANKDGIMRGYRVIHKNDFENEQKYEREARLRRKQLNITDTKQKDSIDTK